jgi:K+-transporting ATPase ATPase B chain
MTDTSTSAGHRHARPVLLDGAGFRAALAGAFAKLSPRHAARNPVMAVVWLGTVLTAVLTLAGKAAPGQGWAITALLFVTVLFANFAEAVAEARGRGQAASLRRARQDLVARRVSSALNGASATTIPAAELRPDDLVVVSAGEIVPADGEIVKGLATINESAVTGESAPVLREAGTDLPMPASSPSARRPACRAWIWQAAATMPRG